MSAMITIIVVIAVIIVLYFSIKGALGRSKSNKTSLFGSFNAEYKDDVLGKMTPSALEGLDEAKRKEGGD